MFSSVDVRVRFMYIIRSEAGQPLREELAKSPQKILTNAFPQFSPKPEGSVTAESITPPSASTSDESHAISLSDWLTSPPANSNASSDAYFQGLALISALVKLMPDWLPNNHVVFDTLVLIWKSPARIARLHNEQELSLAQVSIVV